MKKITKEHLDTCVQAHKDEVKRALELIFFESQSRTNAETPQK